jgi:uncharacterized protein (TIGR03435 family)
MPIARAVLLALFAAAFAPQRAPVPARPAFEVASVKPSPALSGTPTYGVTYQPGGRFIATGSLLYMIEQVFNYRLPDQVVAGPTLDWIRTKRFDVNATAGRDVPREQVNLMARRLLEERFALKHHVEQRDSDVYALVPARGDGKLGPGLKPAAVECAAVDAARARGEDPGPIPPHPDGRRLACGLLDRPVENIMTFVGGGRTMQSLAERLAIFLRVSAGLDRNYAVLDRTGLSGRYDIDLNFVWFANNDDSKGQRIFDAVRDQLGLRLEKRRELLDILVIDHAEEPTHN